MENSHHQNDSAKKALKALILVGGFGTRLRPLTLSKSKPLVEFINKPILCHQIEALKSVGVDEIILAINYQPERMYEFIKEAEKLYSVKITCSKEEEPLGTAGPIGLAKKYLEKSEGEEIFIFNADVTCRFPLAKMLLFHKQHGREGTIAVTKVKDPFKYGVIISDKQGQISKFVEKPQEFVGDNINSGLYIFNKQFLNRVEAKPSSLEREIFPQMAEEGQLFTFQLEGFWADVGQPKDYLHGTNLFLDDLNSTNPNLLSKGKNILGNVVIVDFFNFLALDCRSR
jgi:mannose-1-phosphate guanylyltransferase